jgi:uncharacterized membrane protein SpoIIM required for sporulation
MLSRLTERKQRWAELNQAIEALDKRGADAQSPEQIKRFCQLYRQVIVDLSQARADGGDPDLVRYLNQLAARAHGRVYRSRPVDARPLARFVFGGFPALVRRHWRPILIATAVFYLTALASFLAVIQNPELAYSLFDENVVEFENIRLEKHQGEYKGNFTFNISESPVVAALIIGNNVRVAILAFGFGALACVPGLLLLTFNGRMLGTLTGIVWNHGYFMDFYGLILCHGVLELTAICIAGGSGLMLGWAFIAPGTQTRQAALKGAARDAFGLVGGCILILVVAGLIEGYITPHASAAVRWSVAGASALFLLFYLGLAGRESDIGVDPTDAAASSL